MTALGSAWLWVADSTSVLFGSLFALVWLAGGVHSYVTLPSAGKHRFFAYYLPASLGGTATAFAGDAISFYACFSLMSLASWGLVTHSGTNASRQAGAIYLALTALGEALLLAGLVALSSAAGSTELSAFVNLAPSPGATFGAALVLGAVGVKIGALPLIGILPLTYATAPAGAAAALAGASTKVAALTLVRLLPFGTLPVAVSEAVMVAGLATTFVAVAVGLFAVSARGVLGYSSASQMGLVMLAAGSGLADSAAAELARGAILTLALHHGYAKAALMLGSDVVPGLSSGMRRLGTTLLALPALALVGVPLTTGFAAKYALKDALLALSGVLPETVYALLPWTGIGTALLMLRFFRVLATERTAARSAAAWPGWVVLLLATASAAWLWPGTGSEAAAQGMLAVPALVTALWPGLLAVMLVVALRLARVRPPRWNVRPGDLLLFAPPAIGAADAALVLLRSRRPMRDRSALPALLLRAERVWVSWPVAATAFVALVLALSSLTAG
ncbi:MAG: proton-conducting transporter transmembrane domain-containing protein [Coriobacteriia bacterium]